jgi:hypothetical protein
MGLQALNKPSLQNFQYWVFRDVYTLGPRFSLFLWPRELEMIFDHNWTTISRILKNHAISFFLNPDRVITYSVDRTPRTETGLELQKSPTISMGYAFEFAWMDELYNDENRGPP